MDDIDVVTLLETVLDRRDDLRAFASGGGVNDYASRLADSLPRHVFVTARQAGSAAALAPVVAALARRGDRTSVHAGTDTARLGFERAGLRTTIEISEDSDGERLATFIADNAVTHVLTGTSLEPKIDRRWWSAARLASCPAVALLDDWCNYTERFSERAPFDSLPDALAVMDARAAEALRMAGFPAGRLHITGHPLLDTVIEVTGAEREAARVAIGIDPERPVITFASEPSASGKSSDSKYTVSEALAAIRAAVSLVSPEALVVLRPHPREGRRSAPPGSPETVVIDGPTPRQAIAASDVVTGMTTSLLLEAALAGLPAISVRPGDSHNAYIEGHVGLIVSVSDPSVLPGVLRDALDRSPAPAPIRPRVLEGAADSVVELLLAIDRRENRDAQRAHPAS